MPGPSEEPKKFSPCEIDVGWRNNIVVLYVEPKKFSPCEIDLGWRNNIVTSSTMRSTQNPWLKYILRISVNDFASIV